MELEAVRPTMQPSGQTPTGLSHVTFSIET